MSEQPRSVRLKDVSTYINRGVAPTYVDEDTGFVAFSQKCTRPDRTVDPTLGRAMLDPGRPAELAILREGDLVVNSTGTGTLGRVGLITERHLSDAALVADGHVTIARINPKVADPRFVWYQLSTDTFYELANATLAVGSTNQTELGRSALGGVSLRLPPLDEQRRIVDFLDAETGRIDELIDEQSRLAELLRERRQASAVVEMLAGIDPFNGGLAPHGWEGGRLGSVLTLQRGYDLPADDRRPGVVPVISSGGVSGFHDVAAEKGPGVVTGRYGTVGEVFFSGGPYWPLNTALFVKDFKGNDPRWCFHLLRCLPLASESAKSAVTGINRNVVHRLAIVIPPRVDQVSIARRLDEVEVGTESTVEAILEQVSLLSEHRQALITAAVSGGLEAVRRAA